MFVEYPKALYKGGEWDGVSDPDCVTVSSLAEEEAQAAEGYFPIGTKPQEPAKRGPGRPKKVE